MKKKTRAELETEIERLKPHEYLVTVLLRKESPTLVKYEPPQSDEAGYFKLFALGAAHGGILVTPCGTVYWAERWAGEHQRSIDPYIRDVANRVWRLCVDGVKARYGVVA